jgi:hypothetical protein
VGIGKERLAFVLCHFERHGSSSLQWRIN